jgi:hypothetical protein
MPMRLRQAFSHRILNRLTSHNPRARTVPGPLTDLHQIWPKRNLTIRANGRRYGQLAALLLAPRNDKLVIINWSLSVIATLGLLQRNVMRHNLRRGAAKVHHRNGPLILGPLLPPSVVFDISRQWSVQIGGFMTVAGINAGRELGPLAALWYRF